MVTRSRLIAVMRWVSFANRSKSRCATGSEIRFGLSTPRLKLKSMEDAESGIAIETCGRISRIEYVGFWMSRTDVQPLVRRLTRASAMQAQVSRSAIARERFIR